MGSWFVFVGSHTIRNPTNEFNGYTMVRYYFLSPNHRQNFKFLRSYETQLSFSVIKLYKYLVAIHSSCTASPGSGRRSRFRSLPISFWKTITFPRFGRVISILSCCARECSMRLRFTYNTSVLKYTPFSVPATFTPLVVFTDPWNNRFWVFLHSMVIASLLLLCWS